MHPRHERVPAPARIPHMADEYVVVLTTLPEDADAHGFAGTLIDERLAACVNILPPMKSIYRWMDAVQVETEQQLVIKTSRARVPALWERVRELHPYDVPEFIVLPVIDGHDAYLRWMQESTGEFDEP